MENKKFSHKYVPAVFAEKAQAAKELAEDKSDPKSIAALWDRVGKIETVVGIKTAVSK